MSHDQNFKNLILDYPRPALEFFAAEEATDLAQARIVACDLGRLPVDHYLNSTNIVARLNLPNMNYPPERRIEVYASAQEGLAELEPGTDKRLKYVDYIDQYADLSPDEWEVYCNEYLPRSGQKEAIMGLRQYSREEGIQQGIQQGVPQGEARILQRQLQHRFGPLPEWASEKLAQADQTSLEIWAERVLDAGSLEEVFAEG